MFIQSLKLSCLFSKAFVTKLGDDTNNEGGESIRSKDALDEFSIRTGENTNVKRISSGTSRSLQKMSEPADSQSIFEAEAHSVTSSNSAELFAFDVYEREGFDQIMRTVAGASDQEQEAFARSICDYLEIFESLATGR